MAKVTGIGGVFFKSKNNGADLAAWYQKNLGLDLESWGGAILRWPDDKAEDGGLTVWSAADNDSKWFSPSESSFMINYRVDNQGVTGMNTLGIRQRQEIWQQWISDGKSIQHVLEHLPLVNFDPEFFRQHEPDILAKFNAENQGQTVRLKAKKGLFALFQR